MTSLSGATPYGSQRARRCTGVTGEMQDFADIGSLASLVTLIGERSSHTWFVLKYLLGYPNVRNYDGSWTEWGNLVRTPIEKP